MTSKGLSFALGAALICEALLALFPELDVRFSALFYDAGRNIFPVSRSETAIVLRDVLQTLPWLIAAPAAVALILKLARPASGRWMSARAAVFLLATFLLIPGILSNGIFKNYWNRPRPNETVQFGGTLAFVPWWDPRGACPENCSFFSGEAAAAFWTYAPAALTPAPWRPAAYGAATVLGLGTGLLRVAFGRHFLSDVMAAALAAFGVIWLAHRWLYRRPNPRLADAAIDAALAKTGRRLGAPFRRLTGKEPRNHESGLSAKDPPPAA
jgi:membrane-associated phospholipid phosphatase